MQRNILILLLLLSFGVEIAISFAGHDMSLKGSVDAATQATPKVAALPPLGDTYDVIGYVEGIRKYIIKYADNLYRGGEILSAKGMEGLVRLGVKTIISITPNDKERELAKQYRIKLVEFSFMRETGLNPGQLDQFLEIINKAEGPYYVHCIGGTHRAAALAAAYRIYFQGWLFEEAKNEYERLGGETEKYPNLIESIRRDTDE
jgi:protein tyrosine phosphatase (PTP) superfamily phosphohydrolase (DUF442 family)